MSEPAAAAIPSEMWLGVEQVLVACHLDAVEPAALRDDLCRQLVAEAARLSRYPVRRAEAGETVRDLANLRRQDSQLVLHLEAEPFDGGSRPGTIRISARPERLGLRAWRGEATRPMPVTLDWNGSAATLDGPVPALAFFLSELRREEGLPLPPRSDRL